MPPSSPLLFSLMLLSSIYMYYSVFSVYSKKWNNHAACILYTVLASYRYTHIINPRFGFVVSFCYGMMIWHSLLLSLFPSNLIWCSRRGWCVLCQVWVRLVGTVCQTVFNLEKIALNPPCLSQCILCTVFLCARLFSCSEIKTELVIQLALWYTCIQCIVLNLAEYVHNS